MAFRYPDLGAYSKSFADVISAMNNQAALAEIKQVQAGVYGERRFMVKNTGFYSLMLAVPAFSGNFGIQSDYFGYVDYNESQLGLAYGRKLGENVNLGAKINFLMLRIAGYGNASTMNFEIGTTWALTEKLRTGIHLYNPFGGSFPGIGEEKLPFVFKTGMGYEFSEQLLTGLEASKEENRELNINAVIQYRLPNQFFVRLSISTGTVSNFLGIGYAKKKLRLELAAGYHQQLGFSPGLLLVYQSGKTEK